MQARKSKLATVRVDGHPACRRSLSAALNEETRGLGGHLSTRVCDLLDCRYPIVLAGMGGVARSELVTAVTNAGGFGFLGMVREPRSLIRQEVEAVRRATSQRFGVNLIPQPTASCSKVNFACALTLLFRL